MSNMQIRRKQWTCQPQSRSGARTRTQTAKQQKDSVYVGGYGKFWTLGDDTIPPASSLQGQLLLVIVTKEEAPPPPKNEWKNPNVLLIKKQNNVQTQGVLNYSVGNTNKAELPGGGWASLERTANFPNSKETRQWSEDRKRAGLWGLVKGNNEEELIPIVCCPLARGAERFCQESFR